MWHMDFPGGSDGKASVYNAGDPGSIPGSGRSPGEGNGNPKEMAIHSSTIAWKIPCTEEPGIQSYLMVHKCNVSLKLGSCPR